jgi:uncharacterized protein YjbJ (UPF0337 family)
MYPGSGTEEFSWKDKIEAKWEQWKGAVRLQWGKLTDDDIQQCKGDRERLIGRVMERYRVSREDAEVQVDLWVRTLV